MYLFVLGTVTLDRLMSNDNPRQQESTWVLQRCWVLDCHSLFNLPAFTLQ